MIFPFADASVTCRSMWWLFVQAWAGEPVQTEFLAGSYGRVQASTDLAGGGGAPVNVVSHPPRLELDPYLELDLGWQLTLPDKARFRVMVTPAVSGPLFHYDGNWGDVFTLRNLYVEADQFAPTPLTVWAGSRMYRGDDLYLLDFWPMDNLNTIGGGARWTPPKSEVSLHVGMNRLSDREWQYQEVVVPTSDGVSGEKVVFLDRQRVVGSLRLGREFSVGETTLRARLYGEFHHLPAGERLKDDAYEELGVEMLPSDRGSVIGAQFSAWGFLPQSATHLWVRRATGLAAYGDLTVPTDGLALDLRSAKAQTWTIATSTNLEFGPAGVMFGGYVAYQQDADGQALDFDDRWEVIALARPSVYIGEHVALSAEVSHQHVRPNGLNPRSEAFDQPDITKISFLPGLQTAKGGFARPRIQAIYTVNFVDAEARRFFSEQDVRAQRPVQHYLGIGAEWWINSQRTATP